jgi:hypothetical protein
MRKYILLLLVCISTLFLLSWSYTGHRTVALIAERHLSLQAKTAVAELLDGQSLADVSTWADEVRNKPGYKFRKTNWHFLNLPSGLNEDQFETQVKEQFIKESLYRALILNERTLKRPGSTKEQKAEALKFLIHLVGDAHQPTHISGEEDKRDHTIQIQFDGKGTNLHSLWDSQLLDKQGLSDTQLATELDKATPVQIKQWQSENILYWISESYQIGSQLYSEVKSESKLGDDYYQKHIGTVDERIEKAGIRLAGMLNEAFKGYVPTPTKVDASISEKATSVLIPITSKDALNHIGQLVTVTDYARSFINMGSYYLVYLGAAYPNQHLTIVLRGEAREFAKVLQYEGEYVKRIRVTGKVSESKGEPQIEVSELNKLSHIRVEY